MNALASAVGQRPHEGSQRRRMWAVVALMMVWAVWRAGAEDVVNTRGWSSFADFWAAVVRPELAGEFVRLTADAAVVTLAYAVLGTAVAVAVGAVGALLTSELLFGDRRARSVVAAAFALPRAIHEVIWALLLLQMFGFDPMVAVLAIGIPYGAVTAKVFAEAIDESDREPFEVLRASGSGRLAALFYGVLPTVRRDLLSYGFYRLECAVRSAAVLGVVAVGGLGFQLDLSFETLRYEEIWTLIAALMILSGLIDQWSTTVRRSSDVTVNRLSLVAVAIAVPAAALWVGLDPRTMWSGRTRMLAADLAADLVPPRLGPGGATSLFGALVDTVALSVLGLVFAVVGGLLAAAVARRQGGAIVSNSVVRRVCGAVVRLGLLLARAVPAPIWVFLFVLVLFPGLWPGAVGLGLYNLGVLGRLFADVFETQDSAAADQLKASGSSRASAFFYAALPSAAPRLVALSLYRWEVIVRETVVVGVVGAGGLGVLINEHLVARDFQAVTGAVLALTLLTIGVDRIGSALRRSLR